jgi:endonuclease/exonuclease/phosphatase family metal-dependent hydrolase
MGRMNTTLVISKEPVAMTSPRRPFAPARSVRKSACVAFLAALALVVGPSLGAATDDAAPSTPTALVGAAAPDPISTKIRFAQANIYKEMTDAKFKQDVAAVYAQRPDLITFNEVGVRSTASLLVPGYQLWRTEGHRTGWSPVAWKTSQWSDFDRGTWQISDTPDRLKSKPGIIGVRYVNWVSLVNRAGQILSVVSTHVAPKNDNTAELLVPSLKSMAQLAKMLGKRGAVIIGGDFNMGMRSSRYQPEYLAAAGLTNTFEILGERFVTHSGGGIVDYIFLGPTNHFVVENQYPVAINSDHEMIVANLRLTTGAPGVVVPTFRTRTISVPARSSQAKRRSIRAEELAAIAATPSGAAIHVASGQIEGRGLLSALLKAHQRGVNVTVITSKRRISGLERTLATALGSNSSRSRYFVQVNGQWRRDGRPIPGRLAPTTLLISLAGATPAYALTSNSPMSEAPMKRTFRRGSTARVTPGKAAYDKLYDRYLRVVGRRL